MSRPTLDELRQRRSDLERHRETLRLRLLAIDREREALDREERILLESIHRIEEELDR